MPTGIEPDATPDSIDALSAPVPAAATPDMGDALTSGTADYDAYRASPRGMQDAASGYGIAAMGFSLLGGILKGMASVHAGERNAAVDRKNAALADLSAGDAIARGHFAAQTALLRGAAMAGTQKAAYADAHVAVNSGSALDVLSDTSLMSKMDADIITSNAQREAWGYKTTAQNFRERANLDEVNGRRQASDEVLGGIQGAAQYGAKMMGLL